LTIALAFAHRLAVVLTVLELAPFRGLCCAYMAEVG